MVRWVYSVEKIYETKTTTTHVIILWASRHPPLREQISQLEKKFNSIAIYQVSGVIPSAEALLEVAEKVKAKIIVPVLPLSVIAKLVELTKKQDTIILLAKMNNIAVTRDINEAQRIVAEKPDSRTIATYADGVVRVFEFDKFEKIVEVKLITEPI